MPEDRYSRTRERLAAARARLGSLRPQIDETAANTPEPPKPVAAPSGWKRYAPMAVRGVSGLLSGIASDAPGIGTAIGAGVGAAGEALAEHVGGEEYSPKRIAAEGALGAVPFAGLRKIFGGGRVVGDALAGAAMAGGGEAVRDQVNEGLHLPTSEEMKGVGKAAVIGGGLSGLLGSIFRGRNSKPAEELTVDRYMPNKGGNEPAYREGVPTNRQGFTPNETPPVSLSSEADRLRADLEIDGPGMTPHGRVSDPVASPTPAPRTLGRLTPRSTPNVNESLTSALEDLRTPEAPRRVDMAPVPELPATASSAETRARQVAPAESAPRRAAQRAVPYDPEREYGSFLARSAAEDAEKAATVRGTPADIPNNPAAQRLEKLRVEADQASSVPPPVRGLLPAFGETSEGMAAQRLGIGGSKTRTLRPEQSTLDLANELAQSELGAGARVKSLKSYLRPSGDDELSKALRQRAHIAERQGARQAPKFGSETGSADPEFLKDIAIHGGTGVVGAGIGAMTDPEDRTRGALLGGMVGLGAPAIARNPKAAEALRYFSMLSSPLTHVKNITGNAGSWGIESAVKALSGDAEGAAKLFKAPFLNMGRTKDVARAAFAEGAPETANRTGMAATGRGLLSLPGRAIHAIDAASRDVLERGGLDPERAAKATFSNEPESVVAKGLLGLQRKSGVARAAVPFAKTPLNIVERGIEHSPFAPFMDSSRAQLTAGGAKSREAAARMFLGTALGGGAYAAGLDDPYSIAAAGPAALPVAFGSYLAAGTDETAPDSRLERALRQTARMVPGMTPQVPGSQQFFASYVPNVARDVAEMIDPAADRETPGYFGETGKRIPVVRESLPEKRVGSGSTSAARNKRRPRRPRAR